jgi:hypothetical protein
VQGFETGGMGFRDHVARQLSRAVAGSGRRQAEDWPAPGAFSKESPGGFRLPAILVPKSLPRLDVKA